DKLVLLWLHSHISENVLAYVIACETSRSTWIALEELFDAQSSARDNYLKTTLQDLQKGSLTMIDYIAQKRKLVDSLAEYGYIVQEQDVKNFILRGLDSSDNNFRTSHGLLQFPLPLTKFIAALLREETTMGHSHSGLLPLPFPSANVAQSFSSLNLNPNSQSQPSQSATTPPRLFCQICEKSGHIGRDCYNRGNFNLYPSHSKPRSNNNRRNNNTSSNHNSRNTSNYHNNKKLEALFAFPSSIVDPDWFLDSGANHHVTNQAQNLSSCADYDGNDSLTVGNGMCLPIIHFESCILPASPSPLKLSNVLVVPHITKNLLSISQLTKENDIFVEFHPDRYIVKTPQGQTLLTGHVDNGLYRLPIPSSSSPQAYLGEKTSLEGWHKCLAHPHFALLQQLVHDFQLSISNKCIPD
ncbi:hypothetical protein S83_042986, partial [Arachis hypogaea]